MAFGYKNPVRMVTFTSPWEGGSFTAGGNLTIEPGVLSIRVTAVPETLSSTTFSLSLKTLTSLVSGWDPPWAVSLRNWSLSVRARSKGLGVLLASLAYLVPDIARW